MNALTPLTPTISAIKLESKVDDPMPRIYNDPARLRYLFDDISGSCGGPVFEETPLPPGKWHILGPVSELTPEQKAEIVEIEWLDLPKMKDFGAYDDYDAEGHLNAAGWNEPDGEANYLEAVKKFIEEIEQRFTTLLQSKRVYTENPLGKETPTSPGSFPSLAIHKAKHSEAQQYVGNWILIKKEV